MKFKLSVDIPEHMQRDVKIADQVDHDPHALLKLFRTIIDTPGSPVQLHVEYSAMSRTEIQGR